MDEGASSATGHELDDEEFEDITLELFSSARETGVLTSHRFPVTVHMLGAAEYTGTDGVPERIKRLLI